MACETGHEGATCGKKAASQTLPGADYGLRDGYDPARYQFYNSALHDHVACRSEGYVIARLE